jgi:hypothetical protein
MRDDFRDPNSGWPNPWEDPSYGRGSYANGEYSVTRWANASSRAAYVYTGRGSFGNFRLEVTARLVSASAGGAVAVAFRITQPGSFYALFVQPGTARFSLVRQTGSNLISLVSPATSTAIRRGGEPNRLGIQAIGSEMVVSVNGQEVGRARDDTFSSGTIGLGAGNEEDQQAEARFSDLVVMSIE